MILFRTISSPAQNADPRWRLLPDGKNAIVPVSQLVTFAAHRLFLETVRDEYKDEAYARAKEAAAQRKATEELLKEKEIVDGQLDRARGELADLGGRLEECDEDKAKLKTWARIGQVGTITVSLAVVGIVAERIINSAKKP